MNVIYLIIVLAFTCKTGINEAGKQELRLKVYAISSLILLSCVLVLVLLNITS